MRTIIREAYVERRQPSVRWSAVIAGALVAAASWVVLQMLGVGVGLAAIDTDDAGSLRGVGIGTGIWSVVVPLIALFVGGFVAARASGVVDRGVAAIHGAVLWSLALVIGTFLMMRTIGAIAGTTARAGGEVAEAVGVAVPAGAETMTDVGIDADAVLGPVNERLRAEGKPAVTADELRMASRDAIQRTIREGRFDRDQVVAALARNSALTPEDAEDIAGRLEVQLAEARVRIDEVGERATRTALGAADKTGKALFGAAVGLILGLVTAIGGAILGVHRRALPRDPVVVEERTVP